MGAHDPFYGTLTNIYRKYERLKSLYVRSGQDDTSFYRKLYIRRVFSCFVSRQVCFSANESGGTGILDDKISAAVHAVLT